MLKALIVVLLLAVIASLFSGLTFLIRDESRRSRTVNALIVRVVLSVLLLAVIGIALWTGDLQLRPNPSFGN
jgi:heme/copper-type cytochrome/quinol oxidase subunit 4